MMEWLSVWWRQIVGPPASDPWHDDDRIKRERRDQHDRINKAAGLQIRDDYNRFIRDAWKWRGDEP